MLTPREIRQSLVALVVLFLVVLWAPILSAQAATAAGVPVESNTANEWGGALVWAFFASSALEWLKRNQYITLLTEQTAWLAQRAVGVVLAVAAAAGVHWTFDPAAGQLVIDGLTWGGITTVGTESVRQWVLQELTYRTAVKPYRPVTTGV